MKIITKTLSADILFIFEFAGALASTKDINNCPGKSGISFMYLACPDVCAKASIFGIGFVSGYKDLFVG